MLQIVLSSVMNFARGEYNREARQERVWFLRTLSSAMNRREWYTVTKQILSFVCHWTQCSYLHSQALETGRKQYRSSRGCAIGNVGHGSNLHINIVYK